MGFYLDHQSLSSVSVTLPGLSRCSVPLLSLNPPEPFSCRDRQRSVSMSRAKAILASLRQASSVLSARMPASQSLLLNLIRSPSSHTFSSGFLPSRCGRSFFSSKSTSVLELLLANDSPDAELEKMNPVLSHEDAIYVVKKLDGEPRKALAFFKWVCGREEFNPSSTLYSLIVRILVRKGLMKEFWVTLREMKEQGFYLDEETHGTIQRVLKEVKLESDSVALTHFYQRMREENGRIKDVMRVVSLIAAKDWRYEVERELTEMKILISDDLVIRVLKELRNHPPKALSFFRWSGSFPNFSHNTVTYNAAARVLARDESIEDFWSIVEEMKNKGYEIDIDTYVKIIRQFQKWKMVHEAVKLFEFMMDSPYKPLVKDCSFLLKSLSTWNDIDVELIFRVVKKLESSSTIGKHPKAVYDGIHRCYTAAGRFDLAEDTVKAMKDAGYEPDNFVYSQLMFGLCKEGKLDEACKVIEDMEGQGCPPDIKTWTILIQGLCGANQVARALMQFTQMMARGLDVDADLVDVLVNGFLSQNKVDGAYEFFQEMVDRAKLKPWQATFKLLIDKLIGERKLEEAMQLLRLMKKHNYPPYTEPFTQYIAKHGSVNDASELLKALSVREYPSVATYFHVLQTFFKESRHSEAKDLLYQFPPHIRQHSRISELFGSAKSPAVAA